MHRVQLPDQPSGLFLVIRHEEPERKLGLRDPTSGIDPRRDRVAKVAHGGIVRIDRRRRHEGAQTGTLGGGELFEAEPNDGARLAGHGRQVRNGADRRDAGEVRSRKPATGKQRGRELERQTGACQVAVRIVAVRPMWIDDGCRARQHRSG